MVRSKPVELVTDSRGTNITHPLYNYLCVLCNVCMYEVVVGPMLLALITVPYMQP